MKIVLEWDGDQRDLLAEVDKRGYGEDMELVDSIIWVLDYGDKDTTIMHNNIKITKEE